METCIKGLSREVRLTPLPLPPLNLAVFLWLSFKTLAKKPPSPIKPVTKMLNDGFLHVTKLYSQNMLTEESEGRPGGPGDLKRVSGGPLLRP